MLLLDLPDALLLLVLPPGLLWAAACRALHRLALSNPAPLRVRFQIEAQVGSLHPIVSEGVVVRQLQRLLSLSRLPRVSELRVNAILHIGGVPDAVARVLHPCDGGALDVAVRAMRRLYRLDGVVLTGLHIIAPWMKLSEWNLRMLSPPLSALPARGASEYELEEFTLWSTGASAHMIACVFEHVLHGGAVSHMRRIDFRLLNASGTSLRRDSAVQEACMTLAGRQAGLESLTVRGSAFSGLIGLGCLAHGLSGASFAALTTLHISRVSMFSIDQNQALARSIADDCVHLESLVVSLCFERIAGTLSADAVCRSWTVAVSQLKRLRRCVLTGNLFAMDGSVVLEQTVRFAAHIPRSMRYVDFALAPLPPGTRVSGPLAQTSALRELGVETMPSIFSCARDGVHHVVVGVAMTTILMLSAARVRASPLLFIRARQRALRLLSEHAVDLDEAAQVQNADVLQTLEGTPQCVEAVTLHLRSPRCGGFGGVAQAVETWGRLYAGLGRNMSQRQVVVTLSSAPLQAAPPCLRDDDVVVLERMQRAFARYALTTRIALHGLAHVDAPLRARLDRLGGVDELVRRDME